MRFLSFCGVAFCFFLSLLACTKDRITADQLRAYMLDEKNGLIKSKLNGRITVKAQYKPKDLVLLQEMGGSTAEEKWQHAVSRFDSLDYFVLSFSNEDKELENQYAANQDKLSSIVSYLGGGMSKDLLLITGRDTINVLDIGYARTYGSLTASSALLVFKSYIGKRDDLKDVRLIFSDEEIGVGYCEFVFKANDLHDIPELKRN